MISKLQKNKHIRIELTSNEKGTERKIYPLNNNVQGGTQKCAGGYTKKNRGVHKKEYHNNKPNIIDNNNTDVNTSESTATPAVVLSQKKEIEELKKEMLKLENLNNSLISQKKELGDKLNKQLDKEKQQEKKETTKTAPVATKKETAAQHTTQPEKLAKNKVSACMRVYQEFYNNMQQQEKPKGSKYMLRFNRYPKQVKGLHSIIKNLGFSFKDNNPGVVLPIGEEFAEDVFKPFLQLWQQMHSSKKYWYTKNFLPFRIAAQFEDAQKDMQTFNSNENNSTNSYQAAAGGFVPPAKEKHLSRFAKAEQIINQRTMQKLHALKEKRERGDLGEDAETSFLF